MGRGQAPVSNPATLALGPLSSAYRRRGHNRSCSPSERWAQGVYMLCPLRPALKIPKGSPPHCWPTGHPRWPLLKALQQAAELAAPLGEAFSWRSRRGRC